MKIIRNFFLNNLGWKIVSIILAFILWLIGVNFNNPQINQIYTVPLELQNIQYISDNKLVLLNKTDLDKITVGVKVSAKQKDMELLSQSKIIASIDFSRIDVTNDKNIGQAKPITINVALPNSNYQLIDQDLKSTNVIFDKYNSKRFDLIVSESGKPNKAYDAVVTPTITPASITVSGAQTILDTIGSVIIKADLTDATKDVTIKSAPIIVLDKSGKDVTSSFELSSKNADAVIPIDMYHTVPIATPKWTGTVADGYEITNVDWTPKFAEIIGVEANINNLSYIEIPPIDITGQTASVVKTFDLNEILKTKNLSIKDGTTKTATVTFDIEPVATKTLSVDISNLTIKNQTTNVEIPSSFEITISGPAASLDKITPDQITGTIDLSNLKAGSNKVSVAITLPESDITVVTPVTIDATYTAPTSNEVIKPTKNTFSSGIPNSSN